MQGHVKRRLQWLVFIMLALSLALGLALYALSQNINLYYTPSQLVHTPQVFNQPVQVGGWVKTHSVKHGPQALTQFVITDKRQQMAVTYHGVLPNLFREGQGVVIRGRYIPSGTFIATQVLAKHDANYMPRWLKDNRE